MSFVFSDRGLSQHASNYRAAHTSLVTSRHVIGCQSHTPPCVTETVALEQHVPKDPERVAFLQPVCSDIDTL